jgi:hypothetical protein
MLPQNEASFERWSASPFGPPIYVRRGGLWGKTYGIKARCHWEHPWGTPWERIENLMGTHWGLEGNMLGTKKK